VASFCSKNRHTILITSPFCSLKTPPRSPDTKHCLPNLFATNQHCNKKTRNSKKERGRTKQPCNPIDIIVHPAKPLKLGTHDIVPARHTQDEGIAETWICALRCEVQEETWRGVQEGEGDVKGRGGEAEGEVHEVGGRGDLRRRRHEW
jgi:hypothetical protein